MTTTNDPRNAPRLTVVSTFYVRNADDSIDTRYDVVHVIYEDGRGGVADEYLVRQYDHSDWADGRIFCTSAFDTVTEALALCLRNCGWGTFDLTLSD